jgi:argininosuccinate synthase
VTIQLRRGDDYSIQKTEATYMAYDPDKLSMERVQSSFTPEDRIGALEMLNLSTLDNRALLLHHATQLRALAALTEGPEAGSVMKLLE